MKRITLLLISIFLISIFSLANIDKTTNYGFFVTKLKGSGVISDPLNGKNFLKENMPVLKDDTISLKKKSYIELTDSFGNVIRIGGDKSKVEFGRVENNRVEMKLVKGNIFVNKNTNTLFIIKSGDGFIVTNGGARFLVSKIKGDTNVYCFVGPLLIKTRKVERSLYEPRSAQIFGNEVNIIRTDEYKTNDLYKWADFRDRKINNAISQKFLAFRNVNPVILYELSHYGNWVKHPKWGYVWVPNKIPSDWHPYAYGRWYSVGRDTNLTWISAEPWGFVYYCGNWAFDSKYGWVLVPSRINRPLFNPVEDVCWYVQGDYIYWVWKGFFDRYQYNRIPKDFFSGVTVRDFLKGKFATKRRVKNSIKRLLVSRFRKHNLITNGGELFRKISRTSDYRRYYSSEFGYMMSGGFGGRGLRVGGGATRVRGYVFHGAAAASAGVTPNKPKRK